MPWRTVGCACLLGLGLGGSPVHAETETGYAVIEMGSGRVIAAQRIRQPFIPASVAKLPAAVTILHQLGPEYRFSTTLATTGTVGKDGVLNGDLWLIGGGDPSLVHNDLQDMAKDLAKLGVRKVQGRFFYDASALPAQPVIEPRQPEDVPYNPPLSGLAVDSNRFRVQWPAGKPPQGSADFPLTPVPVDLPSTPLPGNEGWLPVRDPGLFAAQTLAFYAKKAGLSLAAPTPAPSAAGAGMTVLVSHRSDRLADILRATLQYSNNVATEMLALKATGAKSTGDAGAQIAATVEGLLPAVGWAEFALPNASGLTDQARMSPGQCAAIAAHAAGQVEQGQAMRELIPVKMMDLADDEEGPAVKQAAGAPVAVRAKSGTIFYGRALAGVLTTTAGRDLAFCIMSQDLEQRQAYDATPFDQRKADPVRIPAKAWLKQAREEEISLLKGWRGL